MDKKPTPNQLSLADAIANARYLKMKTAVKPDQADANGLIIYNANLEELKASEERILKAAEDGEFVSSSANSPSDPSSHSITTSKEFFERQQLASHLQSLNFSGASEQQLSAFLCKLRAVTDACKSLPFTEVWAAVKPRLNVAILKAVEKETFDSFEALKTFFNKTYGTHTTLYQRMERWSSTSKSNGKTWTRHYSDISTSLMGLKANFNTLMQARHAQSGQTGKYTVTTDDVWSLFEFTKILSDINASDSDLARAVTIELSTLHTPLALANRAESLRVQTSSSSEFSAQAHGGNSKKNPRGKKWSKKADDNDNSEPSDSTTANNSRSGPAGRDRRDDQFDGRRGNPNKSGKSSGSFQKNSSSNGRRQNGAFALREDHSDNEYDVNIDFDRTDDDEAKN
jgi:hypothetical protein